MDGHEYVPARSARHVFVGGEVRLELHGHHEATAASATVTLGPSFEVGVLALAGAMERLAARIEAAGGVVGHLKAFAEQDGAFVRVSVTDAREPAFVQGDASLVVRGASRLQLVAIVLALAPDAAADEVVRALAGLLGQEGGAS